MQHGAVWLRECQNRRSWMCTTRCHRALTLVFLHTQSPRGMALMQRRPTGWTERSTGPEFTAVPESIIMNVYNSVSSITDSGVPAYPKSSGNDADAERADWLDQTQRWALVYGGARVDSHECVQLGVIDHRLWWSCELVVLGEWCRCRTMACIFRRQVPLYLEALMVIDRQLSWALKQTQSC